MAIAANELAKSREFFVEQSEQLKLTEQLKRTQEQMQDQPLRFSPTNKRIQAPYQPEMDPSALQVRTYFPATLISSQMLFPRKLLFPRIYYFLAAIISSQLLFPHSCYFIALLLTCHCQSCHSVDQRHVGHVLKP